MGVNQGRPYTETARLKHNLKWRPRRLQAQRLLQRPLQLCSDFIQLSGAGSRANAATNRPPQGLHRRSQSRPLQKRSNKGNYASNTLCSFATTNLNTTQLSRGHTRSTESVRVPPSWGCCPSRCGSAVSCCRTPRQSRRISCSRQMPKYKSSNGANALCTGGESLPLGRFP